MIRKYCYYTVGASRKCYSLLFTRLFSLTDTKTSVTVDSKSIDVNEESNDVYDDVEPTITFEEVNRKCNKSKLKTIHRNILRGEVPHTEPSEEFHSNLAYMRKLYGKYGSASGVDPCVCWPVAEELALKREYEALSRPLSIEEMIQSSLSKKKEEEENILKREEEIAMKLEKLQKWKDELDARIKRREADALAAKAKKDRLIEEVRRYFGFKVDPKDERFKEMLEKKEKEEKKQAKEAKRKAREAQLLAQLTSLATVKPSEVKSAKPTEERSTTTTEAEISNPPERQS